MPSIFFKKRLPQKWPSVHHNKCDNPECRYPNPPQPAPGKYMCLGRTGDIGCQGQYKVSKDKARGVDVYWRRKFTEESRDHEEETRKRRMEEAERWQTKKRREEETRKENARFDEVFKMEEKRRREAKRKLNADEQRLRSIDRRLKEIGELMKQAESVREAGLYDPELGHYSGVKAGDSRVAGLRQQWDFLLEEYDSLRRSVEQRKNQ